MKIRTDVPDLQSAVTKTNIVNNIPLQQRSGANNVSETVLKNQKFSQSLQSSLNMEKALNDALTIAQASQNVIQKAINLSAKLRSIAADAINSGKVDSIELNEALSSIKSDMKSYGEVVNAPVMNSTSAKEIQPPDIKNEITYLKSHIDTINSNKNRNSSGLDEVIKTLQIKSDLGRAAIQSIHGKLNGIYSDIQNRNGTDPQSAVTALKKSITSEPQISIYAQGNINRDSSEKILST